MALIAITAVLMTSFMAVFQTRSTQNSARHDFLEEVAIVKEELGEWIEDNDHHDVVLNVPQERGEIKYILYRAGGANPSVFFVIFTNKSLCINSRDGFYEVQFETIKNITLKAYEAEGGDIPSGGSGSGKLLLCTITGADDFGNEFSQNLIFALDSGATFANVHAAVAPAIE